MRKTMTFVAIMLLAVAANATDSWEETFDRNGTYIEKVEGQYWPYANQWFTGYTGGSGEVTGSLYSFDYTNVTSQGVSIRAKRLNGASQNTIGLYFPSNKTEDKAFVQFEGALAASAGKRCLVFEICSPESSGGDLSTMVVKVNGNAVTVPATTLGAQYKTSTVYIELPNEAISSIYFAFNNVPSQKFITHPRIVNKDNVIITYTATSKLNETTVTNSSGLHTNAFNVAISSHTFSNGVGMIIFNGEVTTIGYVAFYNCSSLTSITIPNSVTTIGADAFYGCSGLTSVTIPNSVTTIGTDAFADCSGLKTVTIPNFVTTIGTAAFMDCSGLTSVTIPNSVTTIGDYAFCGCSGLTSVTIPNSVTTIAYHAFARCTGLTSVTIPNSVTTIEREAFDGCFGLTSVTIPNSVTTIECWAFNNCSGLPSVTIPNSVTTMVYGAFSGCSGLTFITCYATNPPTCDSTCFYKVNKSIPVYVPAQSVDAYKQADEWKDFTNILPINAEEVPTTDKVIAEPTDNSATITWPQTENADMYTLEIKKNGELICTLTFDANGVLTNITFAAPARGGNRTSSNAEMTGNGYRFTVTGLEPNTTYMYAVTVKSTSQQTLQTYSGEFTTTGGISTDWNQLTDSPVHRFTKIIKDNHLLIFRGDKIYNAAGVEL